MQRKRLWVLGGILLAAGLAVYLLLTFPALAFISSTTHTTFEHFVHGSFYLTGMSNQAGGEVMLISIGLAGDWSTPVITGLPPVFAHAAVEHNGYVYVIGGQTGKVGAQAVLTRSVYFAQVNTQTHTLEAFTRTTELPAWLYPNGVYKHAAVVVGDYLYVLGGDNAAQEPYDVVVYAPFNADGSLGDWNETTFLPAPRGRAPAVTLNGFIYYIGGQPLTGDSVTDIIWYAQPDPVTGDITEWFTAEARLPYPVYHPMAVTFDRIDYPDLLYVIGGYYMDGSSEYARVEVFFTTPLTDTGDIRPGTWISTVILPTNLLAAALVEINGQLILVGGWENPPLPGIWDKARAALLDIESGRIITYQIGNEIVGWFDSPAIQPARYYHTAVTGPDGYIYILGGTDGFTGTPLDENILQVGRMSGDAGNYGYAPRGSYVGPVIDLGRNIKPLFFEWTSYLPTTDTQMRLHYRVRSLQGEWGAWSAGLDPAAPTGLVTTTVPFTQTVLQFQYRLQMTTTNPLSYTPVLHSFKLQYDVVEPPRFIKLANPPSGEGVLQNQPITYTIYVTNTNEQSDITAAYILDILPQGLVYDHLISATPGIAVTYYPITRQLVCDAGTLLAGEAGRISFVATVSPTATGDLVNTAQFHSFEVDASAVTVHYVSELLSPVLTKTAQPPDGGWVWGGLPVRYTLIYSNPNIITLDSVVITDRLPVSTTLVNGSCQPACIVNGDELRWELATLAPLATGQLEFAVLVDPAVISGTQIVNRGYIVGQVSSVGARTPVVASNAVTHQAREKLVQLSKQASPPSGSMVSPGDQIVYTLVYTNSGNSPLQNVIVNDRVPAGTQLVACSPSCNVGVGGLLTWTLATITPTQVGQIQLTVKVGAGTDGAMITNTARLNFESGSVLSNETSHRLSLLYDLMITKNDGIRKAQGGQVLTYTIVYTNYVYSGIVTLTNVIITDDLLSPACMEFVSTPGWNVVSPTRAVYTVGTLPANEGGSLQLSVHIKSPLPPDEVLSARNRVSIGDDGQNGREANPLNNVFVDSDVIRGPDLIVRNVQLPSRFALNSLTNVRLEIVNEGVSPALSWQGSDGPWLAVELYARPQGWGPPTGPHDHAYGWRCAVSGTGCPTDKILNLGFLNSAQPGGVILGVDQSGAVSIPTVFTQTGVYLLYLQADVGFNFLNDPAYGRVQEADEYNNVIFLGTYSVSNKVYLPLVCKRFAGNKIFLPLVLKQYQLSVQTISTYQPEVEALAQGR